MQKKRTEKKRKEKRRHARGDSTCENGDAVVLKVSMTCRL